MWCRASQEDFLLLTVNVSPGQVLQPATGFCSLSTTVKQAGHTSLGWQVDPSIPSLAVAGETTCWTGNLTAPQWESWCDLTELSTTRWCLFLPLPRSVDVAVADTDSRPPRFSICCVEALWSVLISLCTLVRCSQCDSEKWFFSSVLFAGRREAKRRNIWRRSSVSRVFWHVLLAAVSTLPLILFSSLTFFPCFTHSLQRCWWATAGPGGLYYQWDSHTRCLDEQEIKLWNILEKTISGSSWDQLTAIALFYYQRKLISTHPLFY